MVELRVPVRIVVENSAIIPTIISYLNLDPSNCTKKTTNSLLVFLTANSLLKIVENLEDLEADESYENFRMASPFKFPEWISSSIRYAYIPRKPQLLSSPFRDFSYEKHHFKLDDLPSLFSINKYHQKGIIGDGIKIAMVDTGIDRNHNFYSSYMSNFIPASDNAFTDRVGHGTAETGNLVSMAPGSKIIVSNYEDDIAGGLLEALQLNPSIVNCSWGYDEDNKTMSDLEKSDNQMWQIVDEISSIIDQNKHILFVAGAGNQHKAFPASHPLVLSVGGIFKDSNGSLHPSTTYSSHFASQLYEGVLVPDICGLTGERIDSEELGHFLLPLPKGVDYEGCCLPDNLRGNGWGLFSGTSASSPQIAGLCALILGANPDLKPNEVQSLLKLYSKNIASVSGFDYLFPESRVIDSV